MSFVKIIFGVVLPLFILVSVRGQVGLDEICYGCICEAASNCNVSVGCHVPHPGQYFCGPFLISYAYWSDAGKPVLGHDDPEVKGAFENCALDLQCAAATVKAYMTKFSQDCNGDGATTCSDYMKIHKLGGYGCNGHISDQDYILAYDHCAAAFDLN